MISYRAALLAAVTNATPNALNRRAAREAPGRISVREWARTAAMQAAGTQTAAPVGGP